jgi:hypothetical protein
MRSCTSATKSFGSVMSIVQDFSTSPVARDQLFWQRYTSFWVSSLLNRIVFFVIQFVAASIPLGGFTLSFYRWLHIRRAGRRAGAMARDSMMSRFASKFRLDRFDRIPRLMGERR